MAKSMARLDDTGTVVNFEWWDDGAADADDLIAPGDYPVSIGDCYEDGTWYRDGERILTPLEEAQAEIRALTAQLVQLEESYQEGVEDA